MPNWAGWAQGDLLAYWTAFRSPLIATGVALALVLSGRVLRSSLLLGLAGGIGVGAGWYALTGGITGSPRLLVDRLPVVAIGLVVLAGLAHWLAPARARAIVLLLGALLTAWWIAGGPLTRADLAQTLPVMAGVAVGALLLGQIAAAGSAVRPAAAGLTSAAALHAAGAPPVWPLLALSPGLVGLALLAGPTLSGVALIPVALDLAAACASALLSAGRLARGGVGPVEAATVAPFLALWLGPQLGGRLGRFGCSGVALGWVLAGGITVALVWVFRRLQ